jgi:hypothetical protein
LESPTLLIDLQYLPCLEYFTWLLSYDQIMLEIGGNYQKQTYSNRCYILGSQQVDRLTVPVLGGKKKIPYCDVKIDHYQRWSICHWRSITTNYRKSPYFEYLADYFQPILLYPYTYLYELNLALFNRCLELIGWRKSVKIIREYIQSTPTGIIDARYVVRPQVHFSMRKQYQPFFYQQVFGTEFTGNLSIIDLLFCKGPEARDVLQKSRISSRNLVDLT